MTSITFKVHGDPGPQGSKTRTKWGGSREASAKVMPWREAVKAAALQEMGNGWATLAGPLRMTVTFYYRRPANHYGTGRNAGVLKANAPYWKVSAPDQSKLIRSTEDALTDCQLWVDDRLVVEHLARKVWSPDGFQGAIITVNTLEKV